VSKHLFFFVTFFSQKQAIIFFKTAICLFYILIFFFENSTVICIFLLISISAIVPVTCTVQKRSIWDVFRARIATILKNATPRPTVTTKPPVTTIPPVTTQSPTMGSPTQAPTDGSGVPNCGNVNCVGDTPICCPCDSGNNLCSRIGSLCIRSDMC